MQASSSDARVSASEAAREFYNYTFPAFQVEFAPIMRAMLHSSVDEVAEAVDMNEDVTARVLSKVDALAKAVRSARVGQTTV